MAITCLTSLAVQMHVYNCLLDLRPLKLRMSRTTLLRLYSLLCLPASINGITIHIACKAKANQANTPNKNCLKLSSLHHHPHPSSHHVSENWCLWIPLRYFLNPHLLFTHTDKHPIVLLELYLHQTQETDRHCCS